MSTLVFRLRSSRPNFALDMSDEERAIMGRHAAHWQPQIAAGRMVVFGPVLDSTGSWGLAVIDAESEEIEAEIVALTKTDPAVTAGLGELELGRMLQGFVRPGGGGAGLDASAATPNALK